MVPIPDAIPRVRRALFTALSPLAPAFNGVPACYWSRAEDGVADALTNKTLASCLVYQSQDNGGQDTSALSHGRWDGLITVKALASTLAACETQLSGVPAALDTITSPTGFLIQATFTRPLTLPTTDGIAQYGHLYAVTLIRVP